MKKVKIGEAQAGQRLDVAAVYFMPELSRAFVQKLCDLGRIQVNGKPSKVSYKVREGDKLAIDYDIAEQASIPDIDLTILYEDDDCIVLNKPVGVLTHSKGAFNPEATVATFLQSHVKDLQGERAGIVHRLDRATSGVIIGAKTAEALAWLQKQFSQRRVKKTYIAIVEGQLAEKSAIIDMPIGRNPKKPQTFRVDANGKNAITEYNVLESNDKYSLVELTPQTGRTHQLRVHLNHLGHPIVGDDFYGGKPSNRLFLHALQLEITVPSHERKVFTTTLPPEFKELMDSKHA